MDTKYCKDHNSSTWLRHGRYDYDTVQQSQLHRKSFKRGMCFTNGGLWWELYRKKIDRKFVSLLFLLLHVLFEYNSQYLVLEVRKEETQYWRSIRDSTTITQTYGFIYVTSMNIKYVLILSSFNWCQSLLFVFNWLSLFVESDSK